MGRFVWLHTPNGLPLVKSVTRSNGRQTLDQGLIAFRWSETLNSRMPDVAPGCSRVWPINDDASDYETGPSRDSHTNFECARIRSRDGTVGSAMSGKRNGKSNGDEHGCD
jgi:hypothetical protein